MFFLLPSRNELLSDTYYIAPQKANDIWKYQIKWNHFHHMGPEYFFHYFWGHIIFLVFLLSHFIFFLHIKNQNIFLDKNPGPPPDKWSVP